MDFLPEYTFSPKGGSYLPAYRLFAGQKLRLVPGVEPQASVVDAVKVAKEYVRARLNTPIRSEQIAGPVSDEVAAWHLRKAEQRAAEQEAALGAIIVKGGRQVAVERRRVGR